MWRFNQTAEDTCVLNYEDEVLREFGETLQTKVLYFSSKRKLDKGIYLDDGNIFTGIRMNVWCAM